MQKTCRLSLEEKRRLIERDHSVFSIRRQCELLGLNRSSLYIRSRVEPRIESDENLELMALIDRQYMETPFFGSRQMSSWLRRQGYAVGRKRIRRLMKLMGLHGVAPGPETSKKHPENRVYPYLLKDIVVERANHVWSSDITYVRMSGGFMYLTAVIDWGTRYVLSWELSNSLESSFCLKALRESLDRYGKPDIFNTDQGSQYTSGEFTDALLESGIRISMDGRGWAFDNIFTERLWRSVKYECIYLNGYETVPELSEGRGKWFRFYNEKRPQSSLGGDRTPHEAYFGKT